jgi:hypothetical protein
MSRSFCTVFFHDLGDFLTTFIPLTENGKRFHILRCNFCIIISRMVNKRQILPGGPPLQAGYPERQGRVL